MLSSSFLFGLTYFLYLIPLLAIETLILGVRQSYFYRLFIEKDKSSWVDLMISSLFIFGCAHYFTAFFSLGMTSWINEINIGQYRINLYHILHSQIVLWLIYFIFIDFSDYWVHRLMHEWTPLWRIHAYHHSATKFNILTGNRVHFFEEALIVAGRAIILMPFLLDLNEFFIIVFIRRIIDQLQHSDLPWTYGWAGKHLIISPMQHKIHHSSNQEHFDKNYGNIFIVWDKLFKSYIPAKKYDCYPLGTSDKNFDRAIIKRPILMLFVLWLEFLTHIGQTLLTNIKKFYYGLRLNNE